MVVRRRDRLAASIAILGILVLLLSACSGSSGSPEIEASNRAATEQAEAGEHMDADAPMEDGEHADADEQEDAGEPMDEAMSMEHEHAEPPAEYAGLNNPFTGDQAAIAEGAAIFATNCATCHGATGMGDGPVAMTLDPRPAALGDREMMAEMSDSYLFWRVSEGGAMEPFNSAMPAWKFFSEEQIWKLVAFVRTLGN